MLTDQKLNLKYVFITALAVALSWILHEFAHWAVGELLGNDMAMSLNASYPVSGNYVAPEHANIVSAAGPLLTLVQAFVIYLLLKKSNSLTLFPFLLTCLYMRALAAGMNFINLNDEGRIGKSLGIGTFTLPLIISAIFFYLVYDIVKKRQISTRVVVVTTLLVMFFSSILILGDQFLKIRIF